MGISKFTYRTKCDIKVQLAEMAEKISTKISISKANRIRESYSKVRNIFRNVTEKEIQIFETVNPTKYIICIPGESQILPEVNFSISRSTLFTSLKHTINFQQQY